MAVLHTDSIIEYDIPFALLYSVGDDENSEMSSMHSGSLATAPQCFLERTLGVPKGHRAAATPLDLKSRYVKTTIVLRKT